MHYVATELPGEVAEKFEALSATGPPCCHGGGLDARPSSETVSVASARTSSVRSSTRTKPSSLPDRRAWRRGHQFVHREAAPFLHWETRTFRATFRMWYSRLTRPAKRRRA